MFFTPETFLFPYLSIELFIIYLFNIFKNFKYLPSFSSALKLC